MSKPDGTIPGRIPQDLVDTFFDRELDEGSREKFFGMLRADLSRCAEVAKTQRMISMLREPMESPDFRDVVLSRIARRGGFLPERIRRMVTAGRLVAAACILTGILGLALVKRMAPDAMRLTPASRPLSDVIESGKADAAAGVKQMTAAVVAIQVSPSAAAGGEHAASRARAMLGGLTPGKTSVRTLAHAGTGELQLPKGAGSEARFVFVEGMCIDRSTSATVALGAWPVQGDGAACPEAIEQFIVHMVRGMDVTSSGPSTAGRNSVE